MMGGEGHDDFESRTRGVEHYSRAEIHGDTETWCLNDKVQEVIKAKKEARNMLEASE